jgi:flagellar basal-body rod modification protein FlgD
MTTIGSAAAAASTAPTTTKKTESETALGQLSKNSDTFLKLLTTQLQNQDPLSPTNANEFTNQLVQFTQAEQQIKTNSKLDNLLSAFTTSQFGSALSYVGKRIEAKGDKLELVGGAGDMAYTLEKAATNVQVAIYDATGSMVRVMEGAKSAGLNRIKWDGKNSTGATQPDGVYRYAIVAKDTKGAAIKSETRTVGAVSTVDQGSDGIILGVGKTAVKLGDVLSIRAPLASSI